MPRALHSVYSKVKWTAKYDTEDIERTIDSPMIGSGETHVCKTFEFRLDGETKAVTGTHPAQAVFEVGIWRMAGESEGDDSVWRWMLENARNLSMTVICAGNMVRGTCTRITEIIKDNRGNSHLFALRSVKPLKLVKGGQEALDVNVEIMIKAPGTLAHQLPRLLPVVLPSPLPRPFTIHNNLGPLISRPADLAFKVISGLPEQVSYVWAYKDKLAAASQYLEHLVDDREDPVDGFGLLDAGPSVEPANDDSDDEEDANRQKLEESNARKALRENVRQAALRRSGTPEPPEKKRRVDTDIAGEGQPAVLNDDATMNDPPVGVAADQHEPQPGEVTSPRAQVDPVAQRTPRKERPVVPQATIMDVRKPCRCIRVIDVPNCAHSTLQAVIGFILTRQIAFAPLALDGKDKRSSFIRKSIRDDKDAPIPVSPRSVYRLAKRFGLEDLATFALVDFEKKLSSESAAVIALSQDCYNHPDLQELVHNLVRKDFRKVRKSIRKAGDAYEKALFADLVAPLFEDGQIDAALEKIEKKSRKEKARESYEAEQRLFFTRSSSIESLPDSDSE